MRLRIERSDLFSLLRPPVLTMPSESTPTDRIARHAPRSWRSLATQANPRVALALQLSVALFVVAALLGAVFVLGAEFREQGALARIDLAVLTLLQVHGTETGEVIFTAVTWLGMPVLIAVDIGVAMVLAVRRRWLRLTLWLAAIGGGALLDEILKLMYHRARPVYASEFIHGQSWSFPSGHATNSMVGYVMAAYLILEHVHQPWARRSVVAATGLLVGAIGFSRLYLGVHYLSDVLAGYLAGGAWVIVCLVAYRIARHRTAMRPGVRRT